jgi:hypothetical protein
VRLSEPGSTTGSPNETDLLSIKEDGAGTTPQTMPIAEEDFGPQIVGPNAAGGLESLCERLQASGVRRLDAEYQWYQASFTEIAETLPLTSGTGLLDSTAIAGIEILRSQLMNSQMVVNRWLLPTVHGALGAIMYCLVRAIREPFLVPLGARDITLRLFFGAFIGYLIPALFVPSGMMDPQVFGAAPIISLAAFAFGYSIDTFIRLLDRMNSYVTNLPEKKAANSG